jgi:phage I-like protein
MMAVPKISKAAQDFAEPSAEFLTQFRSLITSKAKDGDISDDDVKAIFRAARGYAGGKGKAKKRAEKMEATESLTDMIRDVDSALWAKYPDSRGGSLYWSRETFLDYVIVCESTTQKLYRVPYARNVQGDIEFGEFQEVEEEYIPVEMADLCAKGGNLHLFVEHAFSDPPEWMPILPKPGEFKHPEYGKISITTERNANFIANFENGVYQSKLPINAEHNPSDEGAFGWIVGMRQNTDGSVDAKVNWTDLGTDAIENDRFAYVSPEWVDSYKKNDGTKHKDVLLGAALTVRPFFKEDAMRPLVASERGLELARVQKDDVSESYTFVFTAATPITPEVNMAIDKDARRKRFAEIAKSFKGDIETHLKFMDAIAGDNEKPEEMEVFKAYVARETELAKPVEESKDFTEQIKTLSDQNKELKAVNEKLGGEVVALQKENRRKRFTDVVKDFSGKGEDHVSMLEFIADNEEKGEESDRFKGYVEGQKALASQLKASDLFRSIGDERGGAPRTAAEELDALTHKYIEDHKSENLTFAQAYTRVLDQNPEVYARHTAETRKGVN